MLCFRSAACCSCLLILLLQLAGLCVHAAAPPTVPFYYTGGEFVSHSPEPFETIVLRANRLEQDAMVSACLGYLYGAGGFPRSAGLARIWASKLSWTGSVREGEFLMGLVDYTELPGVELAPVEEFFMGAETLLAQAMKKAGLFDAEMTLQGLRQVNAEISKSMQRIQEEEAEALTVRRQVQSVAQQLSPPEAEKFPLPDETDRYRSATQLLFHAATVGQRFPMKPDWEGINVARFVAGSPKVGGRVAPNLQNAYFNFLLSADASLQAPLIRQAHVGNIQAVRVVASSYLGAAAGFHYSPGLASFWLDKGEELGDALCGIIFAQFTDSTFAWVSAALAQERAKGTLRELADWRKLYLESRMTAAQREYGEKRLQILRKRQEAGSPDSGEKFSKPK